MSNISQLQYISVCAKITEDLFQHLGIRDKTLTEYVVDKAMVCETVDDFISAMNEDEAGFTFKFARSIYSTVHSMLPQKLIQDRRVPAAEVLPPQVPSTESFPGVVYKDPSSLASKFPCLAIPNTTNAEELSVGEEEPQGLKRVKRKESETEDEPPHPEVPPLKHKSRERSRERERRDKKSKKSRESHRRKNSRSRSRSCGSWEEEKRRHKSKREKRKRRRSISRRSVTPPKIGDVYRGYVTMVLRHGILVQLSEWRVRIACSNPSRNAVKDWSTLTTFQVWIL